MVTIFPHVKRHPRRAHKLIKRRTAANYNHHWPSLVRVTGQCIRGPVRFVPLLHAHAVASAERGVAAQEASANRKQEGLLK